MGRLNGVSLGGPRFEGPKIQSPEDQRPENVFVVTAQRKGRACTSALHHIFSGKRSVFRFWFENFLVKPLDECHRFAVADLDIACGKNRGIRITPRASTHKPCVVATCAAAVG